MKTASIIQMWWSQSAAKTPSDLHKVSFHEVYSTTTHKKVYKSQKAYFCALGVLGVKLGICHDTEEPDLISSTEEVWPLLCRGQELN